MTTLFESLAFVAEKKAADNGIQVFLKTEFGDEIKVYDAAGQVPGQTSDNAFFKAGIIIKDRSGNIISNYGGYPETNYFKMAIVAAPIIGLIFFSVRGLIK